MNAQRKSHTLSLSDRETLTVTGVSDLLSFDDSLVTLDINGRLLSIGGGSLTVTSLNLDNGDVIIKGTIDTLAYSSDEIKKSFISRLFG
ncbi:MAG: YabP/YqfC family sporulation protein [Clostridia bacterium]